MAWAAGVDETNGGGLPGGRATAERMLRDAQIRACLTTKRLSVRSETVGVFPADDTPLARRAADMVRDQLKALPNGGADGIVAGALEALVSGWAIGELIWALDGTLESIRWHDPARFALLADPDSGEIAEIEVVDAELRFPADRFVRWAYQSRYGSPTGESDLVAAWEPWQRKQTLRKMWMTALDRFGTPLPVARVPTSWTPNEVAHLASQLANTGNESSLVVSSDVQLDTVLDAGRVEPAKAFLAAVAYEDTQIARALLGQELTTESGSGNGSRALGEVHQGVLDDRVQSLRTEIAGSVLTSQIARRITVAALGPDAPPPRVAFPNLTPAEIEARQKLLTALLTGQVVAPSEGWIRGWLGVPG